MFFYFSIVLEQFERNINKELVLTNQILMNYSLCKEEDVNNDYFIEKGLNDFYCLDLTEFENNAFDFGGFFDGEFVNLLKIDIMKCNEGELNYKGIPCGSEQEQNNLISNQIFASLMVVNSIIDVNDYKSPIKRNIKNLAFGIDSFIIKNLQVCFQNIIIETDDGWIFRNIETRSTLSYSSHGFDINFISSFSDGSYYKNVLGGFYMHTQSQTTNYSRTYMKIQDVLANVGGILKVLTAIGFSISYMINKVNFHREVLSYLINKEKKVINNYNIQSPQVKPLEKIEDQSINKLKEKSFNEIKKEAKRNNFMVEIEEDKKVSTCLFLKIKERIQAEVQYSQTSKRKDLVEAKIGLFDYLKFYLFNSKSMIGIVNSNKRFMSIIDIKTFDKYQKNQNLLVSLMFNEEERKIFE